MKKSAKTRKKQAKRSESSGFGPIEYPELFFGLVGALGVDLSWIYDCLKEQLERVGYTAELIKATELLSGLSKYENLNREDFDSYAARVGEYMDTGNELRESTQQNDIIAMLCIPEIRRRRSEKHDASLDVEERAKKPAEKVAYVIYSLKTPEELELLRNTYGRAFYVVSAYASRDSRIETVAEKLRAEAQDGGIEEYREAARQLIKRDEKESSSSGQNVRGCFPRGDVFIDAGDKAKAEEGLKRFVELIFGHSFRTPTRDEFAMFHAYSAALRSADLARQVGAVITSSEGDLIAVGCNEVPKANGGLYWEGDVPDDRDFLRERDSSDEIRHEMITELIAELRNGGWLNKQKLGSRKNAWATKQLLDKEKDHNLRGTRLMGVIEFGRSVHAEMAALMSAARRGTKVLGSVMYCTTFPCHICARHIVAAGVAKLVYVEPYPKSQAQTMYRTAIQVDAREPRDGRVSFEPFVGIAPRLYDFVFKMTLDRKNNNDGSVIAWNPATSRPKIDRYSPSYILIEEDVLGDALPNSLETAKLNLLDD